jgi:hypothetical protein
MVVCADAPWSVSVAAASADLLGARLPQQGQAGLFAVASQGGRGEPGPHASVRAGALPEVQARPARQLLWTGWTRRRCRNAGLRSPGQRRPLAPLAGLLLLEATPWRLRRVAARVSACCRTRQVLRPQELTQRMPAPDALTPRHLRSGSVVAGRFQARARATGRGLGQARLRSVHGDLQALPLAARAGSLPALGEEPARRDLHQRGWQGVGRLTRTATAQLTALRQPLSPSQPTQRTRRVRS